MSIALVITSGATSFALSRVVRDYALRMRWIDHPNERSSHDSPTPRGGGLAIIVAAVGALIIGALTGVVNARDAVVLGVGAAVLGTVGWLDDIKTLSVALRFGVQAAIALTVVIVVGGLSSLRLGTTTIHLGLAGYLLATVGIVWSINLFNFVDGIDGFAASQAALIFAAAAILFLARGEHSMGLVAAVFGAASAGFLKLNWPPAEIFMGDVGSVSIGFLLATMSIMSENRGSVPLLTFAILGALPIADATVTLVRRLARGNKPVEAHRDHAYQRLSRALGSHRSVTMSAGVATLLLTLVAAISAVYPRTLLIAVIAAYGLVGVLLLAVERRAPA